MGKLSEKTSKVTGCDLRITDYVRGKYPHIDFVEGNIENLPFEDGQFDTVLCTHTLEHVLNLERSISELRRVAKIRLIVVLPKQRPYKYTFSLHVHFFPYAWSVQSVFGNHGESTLKDLGGDWFYIEDRA